MVSMVCGVPGSGKTTLLAHIASKAVAGKPVYLCGKKVCDGHKYVITNFPFVGTYRFDVETLGRVAYEDCLFLLDESTMYFDSRKYKSFSDLLQFFFSQHRKSTLDVVLASQGYDDNDKRIRNVTVNLFKCENLGIFDLFKVTSIDSFFEIVNFQPVYGYEWGRSKIFWGRPLYKKFDTTYTINSKAIEQPLYLPWDEPDEPPEPMQADAITLGL